MSKNLKIILLDVPQNEAPISNFKGMISKESYIQAHFSPQVGPATYEIVLPFLNADQCESWLARLNAIDSLQKRVFVMEAVTDPNKFMAEFFYQR